MALAAARNGALSSTIKHRIAALPKHTPVEPSHIRSRVREAGGPAVDAVFVPAGAVGLTEQAHGL